MIKVLAFIRRKPDITMDAFIRYYESHHAPLVAELLPFYQSYVRNYMVEPFGAREPDGFDVVTELVFADDAIYAAWRERLRDPEVLARIRADEAHFLVSDATRLWVVRSEGTEAA